MPSRRPRAASATALASLRTLFPWLLAALGLIAAVVGLLLVRPWRDRSGDGRVGASGRPTTIDLRSTDRTAANPS